MGEIPKECVECVKLDAVNFTEAEAKLFNEINLKHTSGCFGKEIFSGRDKMVKRDEFEKFVTFLLFCRYFHYLLMHLLIDHTILYSEKRLYWEKHLKNLHGVELPS